MKPQDQSTYDECYAASRTVISRRAAIGSSGLAVLSMLSACASGQETRNEPPREIQERMEQFREFSERMRNAGSPEERTKIMEERNAWERSRAVEQIKNELGISDQEWAVIKPRVEAVYNLVHPQRQASGRGDTRSLSPLEQRSTELRELLASKEAKSEEIKAKLTALRTAKEQDRQELVKARQSLRQLMTLRQEAVLVLNGLLD